jgi:two-component system nitrate/nitrite response regulator NarL
MTIRENLTWNLFTPAQHRVLACVLRGDSNKQIAEQLGCAKRTVEFHVHNILKKAGCESRARLIAMHWGKTP